MDDDTQQQQQQDDSSSGVLDSIYGAMKGAAAGVKSAESTVDGGIDSYEQSVQNMTQQANDETAGIPGLSQVTQAAGWIDNQVAGFTGGVAKGVVGMVGGLASAVVDPVDTMMNLNAMASHIPGTPQYLADKSLEVSSDVANGESVGDSMATRYRTEDGDYWKGVGGALVAPMADSIDKGNYADAAGQQLTVFQTVRAAGANPSVICHRLPWCMIMSPSDIVEFSHW